MVDRDRILARLDALDGYLRELRAIAPARFADYQRTETRRACERLLQISLEAVIGVCALLVSPALAVTLRRMKGLRNLLVHEYGSINDRLVFETVRTRLGDFDAFEGEVLAFLRGTAP